VTDEGLQAIASLPNVNRLILYGTRITDAGVDRLKNMSRLEDLMLNDNDIGDTCLDCLAALPSLKHLYLDQTKVTVAGIERLRRLRPNLDIRAFPEK